MNATLLSRASLSFLSAAGAGAVIFLSAAARDEPGQAVAAEDRQGMVWALSGPGGATVYLAGSVHLLREEDHPVSAAYELAYADSEEIVFEIDMAEMTSPAAMVRMQQLGMLPASESLDQHLSAGTVSRLREYLQGHEAGAMLALALPRFKPGMVFLTISSLEAMRMGARADLGLEMFFFQKASADGKSTWGLETVEYQMSRFDEFTAEEMEQLIIKTLDDVGEMPEVMDRLIASWHQGDEEGMTTLLGEQMDDGNGRLTELLLTERNENWVPHIEEALAGEKNVMFIVGAAHLVGEGGLVDLLQRKGHQLRRVKAPAIPEEREEAA